MEEIEFKSIGSMWREFPKNDSREQALRKFLKTVF